MMHRLDNHKFTSNQLLTLSCGYHTSYNFAYDHMSLQIVSDNNIGGKYFCPQLTLKGFCSKTLSCRHERLFDLWPPILFNYCYGSACSNLCCICFICINMHFQCKAVVYTDLDMIEDGSSLIICLY